MEIEEKQVINKSEESREQQIRLHFLDEAEDCYDRLESTVLGLAESIENTEKLDLALRDAHSVKGGAGMMGFSTLSDVAHRLEDFLKILRVRYHDTQISTEVETLLLQSVDGLRKINEFLRQGLEVDSEWLEGEIKPIFQRLKEDLGELDDEDEKTLFNQNKTTDAELVMFEDEVEPLLDEFENQLNIIPSEEVSSALIDLTEQLMIFSQMASLDAVTELCQSIQEKATTVSLDNIKTLAEASLTILRRSHALVMRQLWDLLPTQLQFNEDVTTHTEELEEDPFPTETEENLDFPIPEWNNDELPNFDEITPLDIESLDIDLTQIQEDLEDLDEDLDHQLESQLKSLIEKSSDNSKLDELNQTIPSEELPLEETDLSNLNKPILSNSLISSEPVVNLSSVNTGKMVRVPVEQLYQFNNLFGKLILERNIVNSRLEQLKSFISLMRQRMRQLEQSNNQLRKWYDRSSLEGIIPVNEQSMETNSNLFNTNNSIHTRHGLSQNPNLDFQNQFDSLEMDRYSDLHLISQDQIESIVQLQEVSTDIEIGLNEVNHAMQQINQTTRSLQNNVTRTQMLPFGEVVKRFPRVIREFSLKFDKRVNLKIEGKSTLIDRAILETLNPILTHLLRNAFDHGIEDTTTRIQAGKSPQGTITLEAINRGTETIITISDDGGGIPLKKIKNRLLQAGISEQEIEETSQEEIIDCIFEPGFTTKEEVTELSGRGVGLDVVRTNLKDIRGNIKVESKTGYGTKFILRVPFTLSILRIMLLEAGGIVFGVSVDTIKEIVRLEPKEFALLKKLNQLSWNKKKIPLIKLEERLKFNRQHKSVQLQGSPVIKKPTALVIGEDTDIGAICLDRVWGEREVTIYSIDSNIPLPLGFIGSMVLGDGRVIPLLDPVQILEGCLAGDFTAPESRSIIIDNENTLKSDKQVNTILIVDDSINVRRYLSLNLEKEGYQVEQARDGQEAVDKLLHGLNCQAVICDIEMPRLDGYGVLGEIKSRAEFQDLPILMLTSRSNDKHRRLAMNLGASDYFSKPYNEQELFKTLNSLTN